MNKEKLWTKDYILISVVNFIMMLSTYLLIVTMVPYTTETYNATTSMAGLVSSIFLIGVLLGRLYGGNQIGKIDNKKMLLVGTSVFVIVTLFYFIASNIYVLLIIRFLHGIGEGYATTATGTIVAEVVPSGRKGEGIGYFSLSFVLATAIGPFLGIHLIENFDYQSIFIFSLVAGVVSLLISFTISESKLSYNLEYTQNKGFKLSSFLEPKALPVSIVMFVIAIAYSGILSFVTTYAAQINLIGAGSVFFIVYAISVLVTRPFTGKLMDKKGGNIVVYPALVSFALGMYLLSQAHSSVVFLSAAALIGLGYGNFQSAIQTLAIKVSPPHRMGLATSTYFFLLDLGIGIGPFLLGYVIHAIGYRDMYLSSIVLIAGGFLLYCLLDGKKENNSL